MRNFLRKCVARTGLAILRKPPKDLPHDPVLDYVMVFHYCRNSRTYRYDRHYELLSRNEHFVCGCCSWRHRTRIIPTGTTGLWFYWSECSRIANRDNPRFLKKAMRMFRYLFLGLGKQLPLHRDGKTSGELEKEAASFPVAIFLEMARLEGKMNAIDRMDIMR